MFLLINFKYNLSHLYKVTFFNALLSVSTNMSINLTWHIRKRFIINNHHRSDAWNYYFIAYIPCTRERESSVSASLHVIIISRDIMLCVYVCVLFNTICKSNRKNYLTYIVECIMSLYYRKKKIIVKNK